MSVDELTILSEIAGNITTVGALLVWVWAERRDVEKESNRVDRLISRMMKELERDSEDMST